MRRRRSQGRKTTETRATDNLSLPDSVIETRCQEIAILHLRLHQIKIITSSRDAFSISNLNVMVVETLN